MNDYLIAEFIGNIDEIVRQPIHLTQRIKYTSCDVSANYIVFGASSGGLYVFQRHPCVFDKLIPSTEGSVSYVSISPDEKLFAFATAKGTVCLVDISRNVDIQVYNEHVGSMVTEMKWNYQSDELFVGDSTGKISVVVNANFITKTMFQTPCSPLLQLDSRIIQIDTCCNFLLVSTLSRCYLCDTEKEQYRQIGHKLRDGDYGACFFGANGASPIAVRQQQFGNFKILGEKETFNTSVGLENFKIYCARPGLRLWECQIKGNVSRTHQFKQAIQNADRVIPIKDTDCRLEHFESPTSQSNTYNFIKMYVLNRHFILTFKKDAIFILDPVNGRIVVWTDQFSNILDVKIVKNFIYIITQTLSLHVLLFSSLETFILKCLFNKQYFLCGDLCLIYEKEVKHLVKTSEKLHHLSVLDEKLLELGELELREYLFGVLEEVKKIKKNVQRLDSGIVVVDNVHNISNMICEIERKECNDSKLIKIFEQYELEKAIGNCNSKVLTDVLNECSFDDIYKVFQALETLGEAKQTNKTDLQTWCYHQCLSYVYTNRDYVLFLFSANLDESLGLYLKEAFLKLNSMDTPACECTYPLPKASKNPPKFLEIGGCILERFLNTPKATEFCCKVPYMWNKLLKTQTDLSNLPLILQLSDQHLLEFFLKKFTYDLWHDALKLFILLKSGHCLKCETSISIEDTIPWNVFTSKILKSIGAESTVELLLQFADSIPKNSLDAVFYQSTIFSSMVENFQSNLRVNAIDFVKSVSGSEERADFEKLMEKTLQNPSSGTIFNKPINSKMDASCSGCSMPLQTPVLLKENLVFLNCGHSFHNICFKRQKNLCNCDTELRCE